MLSGKSGSGKSTACERILENRYLAGNAKIIDLYDEGRWENCTWSMPNNSAKLIHTCHNYGLEYERKCKVYESTTKQSEPRGFPNDIYLACGSELQNKNTFPANFHIVSFDESDITISDMYYLFGQSKNIYSVISQIQFLFGEDITLKDLGDIVGLGLDPRTHKRYNQRQLIIPPMTKGVILRNIRRLQVSGLFSHKCEKINFDEILNDTEHVTSFSAALLDPELTNIFFGLIMKKCYEYKRIKRAKPALIIYFRELSTLMQPQWSFAYFYFKNLMRQGRDVLGGADGTKGMILGDTQNMNDIDRSILGQFGYQIVMKQDVGACLEILKVMNIPRKTLYSIPNFKTGMGMVVTGNSYTYPVIIPAPRHWHKEEGQDVLKILAKRYGEKTYDWNDLMSDINSQGNAQL